jgi:uncharacterized membrane protein
MANCKNCGKRIGDSASFCPSCGAAVKGKAAKPAEQKANANDAEQNKVMAILAYILFFIPLITGDHRKSPFVRFHTNQGTVLFLAIIAYSIVFAILTAILTAILIAIGAWGLLAVIGTLLGLLWFVPLVLCIIGIINAATGKMKPLPLIGRFTIVK